MARLLVAGPAQLDVREILTKLTEAASYPVARRYGGQRASIPCILRALSRLVKA
jgi:hypothetical protein